MNYGKSKRKSFEASSFSSLFGSSLRLERRKELRQNRPVPASDDAGRSDAGDAAKGSK